MIFIYLILKCFSNIQFLFDVTLKCFCSDIDNIMVPVNCGMCCIPMYKYKYKLIKVLFCNKGFSRLINPMQLS